MSVSTAPAPPPRGSPAPPTSEPVSARSEHSAPEGELRTEVAGVLGLLITAVSLLVGLSAVFGVSASLLNQPSAWFTLSFEVAIAAASVFGALVGRGWYRAGPAMTLLCVSGTAAAGSLFGYLGSGRVLMNADITLVLVARLAAAVILLASAGVIVFKRNPARSLPHLIRGALLGGGFAAVVAIAYVGRGVVAGLHPVIALTVGAIVAVGALVLASMSVHGLIRAFEVNSDVPERT